MPKQATSSRTKSKSNDTPPSRASSSSPQPPNLKQLKADNTKIPGIIKNASDAYEYLESKQWILPGQKITNTHFATILLSLVTTLSPRRATDKSPDTVNNVIKAVAYLLKDAMVAKYVEKITHQLTDLKTLNNTPQSNIETTPHLNDMLTNIHATICKQTDAIQKTNEALEKLQANRTANIDNHQQNLPYREALLNGHPPPTQVTTPHEARILNRLNISDHQIMLEVQSEKDNILKDAFPHEVDPYGKIKSALNAWLENSDESNQPPKKSNIHAISKYRKNKMLIEANTIESATWIKQNSNQFLQQLIGHPVKILGRMFLVVARFMPVLFCTDDGGAHDLENSANLPPNSISQVSWIKNPENRTDGQRYTNVKIFCSSAKTANQLILEAGRFKHLGSNLRIHKDIKAPSTCNRCQTYGHISTGCPNESSTCARCASSHHATKCTSSTIKCTPCGSGTHQTNDERCPERTARENAILTKNPETLSPYYTTYEPWTWGLSKTEPSQESSNNEPSKNTSSASTSNTCQKKGNQQPKGNQGQQSTLFDGGIRRQQAPTGPNGNPTSMRKIDEQGNHAPTDEHSNTPSTAQPSNTSTALPQPQPTNTAQ